MRFMRIVIPESSQILKRRSFLWGGETVCGLHAIECLGRVVMVWKTASIFKERSGWR